MGSNRRGREHGQRLRRSGRHRRARGVHGARRRRQCHRSARHRPRAVACFSSPMPRLVSLTWTWSDPRTEAARPARQVSRDQRGRPDVGIVPRGRVFSPRPLTDRAASPRNPSRRGSRHLAVTTTFIVNPSLSAGGLQPTHVPRDPGCLRAVSSAHLLDRRGQVVPYGPLAQRHRIGDLGDRRLLGAGFEDLALSLRGAGSPPRRGRQAKKTDPRRVDRRRLFGSRMRARSRGASFSTKPVAPASIAWRR